MGDGSTPPLPLSLLPIFVLGRSVVRLLTFNRIRREGINEGYGKLEVLHVRSSLGFVCPFRIHPLH